MKRGKRMQLREELWERQSGLCYLCAFPMSKKFGTGMWATLDHKIARVKGGDDDGGNVRLAHSGCNNAKGEEDIWGFKLKRPAKRR